jgi:hypothetical protein
METAPLKTFATWARTSLIREVTARITAVLAPGSPERVEQPGAVAALEKAVQAAGGGDKGRASVADTVAYTWFNRIIALRFMDANGYTGIGVVSPQKGVDLGQPEILAEAKRGIIDSEVASQKTRATVAGLLDGSRVSVDPQGEAFALLLAAYCRHWNKAMPFMFEREGDFTELLIPANLLSDDSVLNRAVEVMTEDVCQDVEVIGWLYQFYISERKDEVFAGFKKGKKAGPEEIPAATQLFTPHWIVRYLVENSIGRLWMLNHPSSRLVEVMEYYVAPGEEEPEFLRIATPEELTVIDPACGSGHMLTYAFELLYLIYEEAGYAPAEIPALIISRNLYGTEIDPRAATLAAFSLTMKGRSVYRNFLKALVEPNIQVIQNIHFNQSELDLLPGADRMGAADREFWNQFARADTLGSLVRPSGEDVVEIGGDLESLVGEGDLFAEDVVLRAKRVLMQAKMLSASYAVVIANPPYMTHRNMSAMLSQYLKEECPLASGDLFAAFISRSMQFASERGLVAMITMQTWMFGSSFQQLREWMLREGAVKSMAHLGTQAFDSIGGAVVSTTAFVCQRGASAASLGSFIDLTTFAGEQLKSRALLQATSGSKPEAFWVSGVTFLRIPGSPIAYWISKGAVDAFSSSPPLSSIAQFKAGISTGDNEQFERLWHEVSLKDIGLTGVGHEVGITRWTPCNSGGRFRRWYGNNGAVMDWQSDGERIRAHSGSAVRNSQYMGRSGITYSKVGGSTFAARLYEDGYVFDDAGRGIFADSELELCVIAGLLNSRVGQYFLDVMSPGLNFTSTEMGNVPLKDVDSSLVTGYVRSAVAISKKDWNAQETSRDFERSELRLRGMQGSSIGELVLSAIAARRAQVEELDAIEGAIDEHFATTYGLLDSLRDAPPRAAVSLWANPLHRFGLTDFDGELESKLTTVLIEDLVSYAVGCMFGRFSVDVPGLILADQGGTYEEFLAKVPSPSFTPDRDGVIPIVDGEWFDDDVVERFRHFLRAAFGDQCFEENLRFVTEALGVRTLRDYFLRAFYGDHVQRYKKRPIYWLFSSPNGSFNALIYMHRYTPSTVSTVLNEYLREFQAKLKASLEHAERSNDGKEADRLRKILLELDGYEHDVLYPLASQNIALDLDDGVKVNYPKFGAALKKIVGLEASE